MLPVGTLGFRNADTLRRVFSGEYRRYTYSIPLTSVPATTSQQATASIDSATDFICDMITGRVFYDSGAKINREVDFFINVAPRLQIIDQGSGSGLFDRDDVTFPNIFGTAEDPFELEQPHRFLARTIITVLINNVDSVAMRVQVAFHGFKCRPQVGGS